jgi:hypothetical protein
LNRTACSNSSRSRLRVRLGGGGECAHPSARSARSAKGIPATRLGDAECSMIRSLCLTSSVRIARDSRPTSAVRGECSNAIGMRTPAASDKQIVGPELRTRSYVLARQQRPSLSMQASGEGRKTRPFATGGLPGVREAPLPGGNASAGRSPGAEVRRGSKAGACARYARRAAACAASAGLAPAVAE